MKVTAIVFCALIIPLSFSEITIVKNPQNVTVCINTTVGINCGYNGTNLNPNITIPNWNITFRNDDDATTYNSDDIVVGLISGLCWSPDVTSEDNNSPNSKLFVGPVNETHNQSSYQCFIDTGLLDPAISEVGTITVVDEPPVDINVDEICTTCASITISLNTCNHPACGDVSPNVTISGNVIYPDTINGSKYTIDNLQSDTLYNITVTSNYSNCYSEKHSRSLRARPPQAPHPVNASSIDIKRTKNNITVTWKAPEIDTCSMLPIEHYDVRINTSKGEVIKNKTVETTLTYKDMDKGLNITYTVNITVVDINGQRNSTVTEKTVRDPTAGIGGSKISSTSCVDTIVIIAMAVVAVGL